MCRIALNNFLGVLKVLVVNSAFLYAVPILSVNYVFATDMESLPRAGMGKLLLIVQSLVEKRIEGTQRYCPLKPDTVKMRHSPPNFAVSSIRVKIC